MERPSAAKKKNQNNAKAKRAHGGEIQPEKSFGGSDFQLDKTPWILVSAGDWRAASASQSLLSPYKKQAICLLFSWITQGEAHKSAGTAKKQLSVDPRSFPASQVEFLPLICQPKCSKTHGTGASWAHTSGPGGFWSPDFPFPSRRAVPLQLRNRNQPSENPRWESFPMVVAEPPPKISSQTRAGAVFRERFKEREPKKINK